VSKNREGLLQDFQKNKYNRTLEEVEELLHSYGFIERAAAKEASVWKRGPIGLTLPRPKTGTLLVSYVSLVLRKIREAEETGIPEERQP
jgi:hypothetical protein